jgi:hypothetical protein
VALGVALASDAVVRVERAMPDLRGKRAMDGGWPIGRGRAQCPHREVGLVTALAESGRGGVTRSMRAAASAGSEAQVMRVAMRVHRRAAESRQKGLSEALFQIQWLPI